MANAWARDRATRFYGGYALVGLAVVALGFSTTYFLPIARRTFAAPWFVHLHGLASLCWILFVISQSHLVRTTRTPTHRRLGQFALPMAVLIWASGIATQRWATERDLPELGTAATSSLVGTVSGLTLFLILVIAGLALRRRPDWHKRLMLLATIHVLWPAFFRLRHLLPMVPKPEISLALILAYSPILIAAVRDKMRYGKVHPVWLFIGTALFVEQSLEVATFDSPLWQRAGQALNAALS
jgi:hypothetical protein